MCEASDQTGRRVPGLCARQNPQERGEPRASRVCQGGCSALLVCQAFVPAGLCWVPSPDQEGHSDLWLQWHTGCPLRAAGSIWEEGIYGWN